MTVLLINGNEYSFDTISKAQFGDLFTLKVKTAAMGVGVSLKTINETFDRVAKQAETEGFNPLDLLDDEVYMANIAGVIYLTRRGAGENITVEDAFATSFNDFQFDSDDDDEAGDVAPKESAPEPAEIVS